jgi:hypothetical protein
MSNGSSITSIINIIAAKALDTAALGRATG